jgi:flagellar protein FliT
MNPQLLNYYEAIERASAHMLQAARLGNWDEVVKLEGACVLLISQLKSASAELFEGDEQGTGSLPDVATWPVALRKAKTRLMQRILVNDAEIRQLAEPWLEELDKSLAGRQNTLH